MKQRLMTGWNAMRVIRLLAGLAVLIQGVVLGEIFPILMGVLFSALAVMNTCVTGACVAPAYSRRSAQPSTEE